LLQKKRLLSEKNAIKTKYFSHESAHHISGANTKINHAEEIISRAYRKKETEWYGYNE
jgi:hypothetical protein